MAPQHSHWWKRVLNPEEWLRFNIETVSGDCLAPLIPAGFSFVLFDRKADIRRGDLILFNTHSGLSIGSLKERLTVLGYVKRFLGANFAGGTFEFEMTNPPTHFTAQLDDIKWAYRARAQGSLWHVLMAWWAIMRDPTAHDERLGAVSSRSEAGN